MTPDQSIDAQTLKAPCKVNLHLGVYPGRDTRGYHRVDSLMVALDVCDEIVLENSTQLTVTHTPALEVAPEATTVWKAVQVLAAVYGKDPHVNIQITAHIPESAGLGGSSADAACVMRGLARTWGLDLTNPEIFATFTQVARQIGADTPFFLRPEPSLYVGAGDIYEKSYVVPCQPDALPDLSASYETDVSRDPRSPRASDALHYLTFVLLKPVGVGMSAEVAYTAFDNNPTQPCAYHELESALLSGDIQGIAQNLYNNLAAAATVCEPRIQEPLMWLLDQPEVLGAQISGSGSCSFAICEDSAAADAVLARAEECSQDRKARGLSAWSAWKAHLLQPTY